MSPAAFVNETTANTPAYSGKVLQAPQEYRRAPPNLAGCWSADEELLAYFYSIVGQRVVACPAEYVVHFDLAYVYEGRHVITPDMVWLAPSVADFNDADRALPALKDRITTGQIVRQPAAGKPNVVIAKAGSDNYGHTLVEILPKIVNIGRSGMRDIRLLLPEGMTHFANTMTVLLGCLDIRAELVVVPAGQLAAIENLHYFGPVSQHNIRKSGTLLVFRDLLRHAFCVRPQPSRKLFVDRRGSDQRQLANGPAVRALMQARGFEVVHPAGVSFAEQVMLFSQASDIVGPLGAGLSNILLAPAQCRVTMIDPGLADYFFWDLAALAGQRFTWLFAGPVSRFSQELANHSYAVSMDGLRFALDQDRGTEPRHG